MSFERALERVYFFTSNTDKYLQARRFFDQHGLTIDYFKSHTEPYDEDEDGSSRDLLTKALAEVITQVGAGRLVFIEDTSVRIEALSTGEVDFPGLRVKGWFKDTSWEECDAQLRALGSDRRATVKSDIALHLPGIERPVFFHGETSGTVADSPPTFDANAQYPWLSPATFNGWFVPDGYTEPLGALSPEESWRVDFRIRAFGAMVERIEEYAAALNLPAGAYRRRRKLILPKDEPLTLFDSGDRPNPALLVVGRTCAGKTTFAEYVSGRQGLLSIEASSVVRTLGVPHQDEDDADGFSYAMRVLDTLGHDVVAKQIVERYGSDLEGPFVVSGLRDIEELRYFRENVPRCKIVLVEASERTRFDRHTRRRRPGAETRLADFRARDRRQDLFGILPVVEDLADARILNEGRMEDFHAQIDGLLAGHTGIAGLTVAIQPRHGPEHNQLFRCLTLLRIHGGLQCDEIERFSVEAGGSRIRHNNANKVLKAFPALAQRVDADLDAESSRVRYQIRPGGISYLELMALRPSYGATHD